MNLRRWFNAVWPVDEDRMKLASEYRVLAAQQRVLADIGLRCKVWDPNPPGISDRDAAVNEGKRAAALEILRICDTDPRSLFATLPKREQHDPRLTDGATR